MHRCVCASLLGSINKFESVSQFYLNDSEIQICFRKWNLPCQAPSNIGLPSRRDHTISGRGWPVAAQRNRKKLSSTTTMGLSGTPMIVVNNKSGNQSINSHVHIHERTHARTHGVRRNVDKSSLICDGA